MLADANLIWSNCQLYNTEDSFVYEASVKLEAAFRKAWEAAGLPNAPPDATIHRTLPDNHPVKDAPTSRRTPRGPREVDDVTSGPEVSSVVPPPQPQVKRKRDSGPAPEIVPSGDQVKRRRTAASTTPDGPPSEVPKPPGRGGNRGRGRGKDVDPPEEQMERTPDVVKRGKRRGALMQEESPSEGLPARGTLQEPEQEPEKRSSRRQSSRISPDEVDVQPSTRTAGKKEKPVIKTSGKRRG